MGDDRLIILLFQEPLKSDLDPRLLCHMAAELLRIPPFQNDLVSIIILICKSLHVPFFYICDRLRDLIDRISIHFPAKLDLGFHFIAVGHCHIAHIVCHSHDPDMAALDDSHRCTHPGSDLLLYLFVRPVTHDHFPLDPHPGKDMSELASPVCRLVLVHEIHVNGIVWDLHVKLGVQVEQRFSVLLESQDP